MLLTGWLKSLASRVSSGTSTSCRTRKRRHFCGPAPVAVECLEERALLTVTFEFAYAGAIGSGIGFEDATNGQARRDALELAAFRLGNIFDHTATITMGVTSTDDSGSSTLASAGTEFVAVLNNGFDNNEVVRSKILTGTDLNGADVDGTVDVNWGQDWGLSADPADISGAEYDYFSTIYHELLHAVGFSSTPTVDGDDLNGNAPIGQAGAWGFFDQFITDVSGTPIINGTTFALDSAAYDSLKVGGASPAGGLFFNGTNARAANGGNPVGLYTPTTFEDGSSVAHLDDENAALGNLVMLSATDTGPGARNLSTLERAILNDLGYSLVAGAISVVQSDGTTSVSETATTDTFDVVLTSAPLVDVVINVTSGDTSEATVDKSTLTFTPTNWHIIQTVTVTGVDDALIDGTQTTSVTLTVDDAASDDGFDAAADVTVSVMTTDDEVAPAIVVTQSDDTTGVAESGTTDTFDVVLSVAPVTDVVVTVTSGNTAEATVDLATLTFTPANWNVAQTVTVTGVDDNLDDGDQTTLVTLSIDDASSDDVYDDAADQTVSVTTTDDDSVGFTITETDVSTSVSESGTTDTFTVVLDVIPASDVVITVVSANVNEATVDMATLTFTPANWNVAQTVTVTGVDDSLDDGDQTTLVTLSIDAAGSDDAFDALADQTVSVTTTDDDSVGFTITETDVSTSVSESGTTDTFTVVLDVIPASDVVVTVTSGNTAEATVDLATLTFTPANWNVAQTVTVTGVDDSLDDGDQTTLVTLSIDAAGSDDAFDALADQTVSVTTTDDDSVGFTITETDVSTSVSESGTTDTFTVVLDVIPASDVVITVVSANVNEVTVDLATLTFTPANWNVAQTVTVTGIDDILKDGDQVTLVTLGIDAANSDDAFDALADQMVSVTTTDDDQPGLTVTQTDSSTSVSESGTTDTFDVVLTVQPATDVIITVVSADTGEATVDKATLTFTSVNWNVAQTVTVTGIDDNLIDGSQTTILTLSVDDAGSDDEFDLVTDVTVSVTTVDDDMAGFTVTESNGSTIVSETGSTDTFEVVLDVMPTADVVINVVSGNAGEVTVAPAILTFTSANWNVPQIVTVTGVDDDLDDGMQTTIVTLSIDADASDDAFDLLAEQTVAVATTDDEAVPGFIITESDGNTAVSEPRTTDTVTVVLTAQPIADVVLTITSADLSELKIVDAVVTFTFANWNVPQTVTVRGADDALIDGEQTTLVTFSIDDAASDDIYDAVADQAISVTTADNEILAKATLTAPAGDQIPQRPTVQWLAVADAETYEIWINQIGSPDTVVFRQSDISGTSFTLPEDLDVDSTFRVWVRAHNSVSSGPWSNSSTFSTGTLPTTPGLIGPSGSTTSQPTFTWTASAAATVYDLWVSQIGGTPQIIRETALTGTSFTPSTTLPEGSYRAWLRAENSVGFSSWTGAVVFTVGTAPGSVSLTAPIGSTTSRPTIQWTSTPLASVYELWVNQIGGSSRIIHETTLATTSFTQTVDLPAGSYRAWVRAISEGGLAGSWSAAVVFTV